MILLIGASGYIGSAFVAELNRRRWQYLTLKHDQCSRDMTIATSVELVINCAGFIPKESVALCDKSPFDTIDGNLLFPEILSNVCIRHHVPFAHISTGCLWNDGQEHMEEDLPQRYFSGYCGFYIGIKVLAERAIQLKNPNHYIWRIRLPFDEHDNPRNYLTKMIQQQEIWDCRNSISHRADFAKACLDLWVVRAPFGTYHVMNPGSIKATDIIDELFHRGIRKTIPKVVKSPVGDCRSSVHKLLKMGINIRSVEEAITESLNHWIKE